MWSQYALALGLLVPAMVLRWALDPVLGERLPFVTLFAALLPLVLLVRPGPFLVASIVGCAAAVLFFISPRYGLSLQHEITQLQVGLFALAAGIATLTASISRHVQERSRRAEHALRESEERFRILADHAPVLLWINGPTGCEYVSRPYLDFLGLTLQQVQGMNWAEAVHPDDRETYVGGYLRALEKREVFRNEFRFRRADGEYRHFQSVGVPRLGPHGEFLGYVGCSLDITDLKRAGQALRDSEARYRTLFEVAIYGVVTIDESGIIESANPATQRLFGYSTAELIGRNISMLMPDPYRVEHDTYLHNYRRTGIRKIIGIGREVVGLRKDGSTFPMDLAVNEFRIGEKRYFKGMIHDITERKRAEDALRESEQRFRLMADAAPVLIWLSGTDKLCTWFNKRWLEFVGRSMEQEIGNGWADNVHPDDFHRCLDTYVQSFDARRPFSMEYRLKRHDGEYRWVLDNCEPRTGPDGSFAGYIGSCIDITELREFQTQLERQVDQRTEDVKRAERHLATAERMAAVGTLASGLAHDINNITLPLGSRIDDLLNKPAMDPRIKGELAVITALLDHLRMMSRNLSLFSRDPDQEGIIGSTELASWCVNVQGLLEASISTREGRATGRWVRLKCDVPTGLPAVTIAPHRLSQAVLNLVQNARDAILAAHEQNGATANKEPGCIRIEARPGNDGHAVLLKVSDNGCGMDEKTIRRAIEPFFTTKARPSAAGGGGSGLGLTLAQAICQRSGGRLDIESTLGKGTTITLTLAVAGEQAVGRESEKTSSAPIPSEAPAVRTA